jgi:rSAM/selenodomain-associated transferase 1
MVDRALVVMGKIPRPGRVKTRLVPAISPEAAASLYRAFLEDVFDVVDEARRRSPYPFERVFACALADDEDGGVAHGLAPPGWRVQFQRGQDLGERIGRAYEDAAAFSTVIIGSDAPTMPPDRILEAFRALDEGARAVFGPTADGGYDLIGLSAIESALLEDIPWSTDQVMSATRARAKAAGLAIRELSIGYDVDTMEDLERVLEDARRPGSVARRTAAAIREVLGD